MVAFERNDAEVEQKMQSWMTTSQEPVGVDKRRADIWGHGWWKQRGEKHLKERTNEGHERVQMAPNSEKKTKSNKRNSRNVRQ